LTRPDLPSRALSQAQSQWLAPLRSRLLRRAHIARRRRVLDLGAGDGQVSAELARRCPGEVLALDRHPPPPHDGITAVTADAAALPFPDGHLDLVFTQLALLWMPLSPVLDELARVLSPDGALVALEPDFGGLIEHPAETAVRPLWEAALTRSGADPHVARAIPGALRQRGFHVSVLLPAQVGTPSPLRYDLLAELPLQPPERQALNRARAAGHRAGPDALSFLPVFGIHATRPGSR